MNRLKDVFERHSTKRINSINDNVNTVMSFDQFEAAVRDLIPITWEELLMQKPSLPDGQRKAWEAFIQVCNEPIPDGEGKEYLYGMIKMQAFIAGRSFEYEKTFQPDKPETT